MSLDREIVDAVRDMDEHELRRLMMLATARLEKSGVSLANGVDRGFRLREQMIRCGKPSCGRCPHGPYWYAYWREDGRRRSRYIGRLQDITGGRDSAYPTDIAN